MSIPDFIPAGSNSPFGDGGFRDWIPSKEEPKEEKTKEVGGKKVPISKLQRQDLTDEDLRDIGIDPTRYRRAVEENEEDAIAGLAKKLEETEKEDEAEL